MSFGKTYRKEIEQEHSSNCAAHGCQMRGTMSRDGGKYLCFCHYECEDAALWPEISRRISDERFLRAAIKEVTSIDEASWSNGYWEMMAKYFDSEPSMRPTGDEKKKHEWYVYRLRDELKYRCDLIFKRPMPRESVNPSKKGNTGLFAKGIA